MQWIVMGAGAVALVLLLGRRRKTPRQRVTVFLLAIVVGVGALFALRPASTPEKVPMDDAMRAHLAEQQVLVADWHGSYQRYIGRLDRNWQRYHRILQAFADDEISIESACVRLSRLVDATEDYTGALADLAPDAEMDEKTRALVTAILDKTRIYAAAQAKTIRLTMAAAERARDGNEVQEEQSRHLHEVMILEAPVGLFTAEELMALRAYVEVQE